jgi:hypothetical protein
MFGIDIIGDIHGHADPLHQLLKLMDYREIDGVYYHHERKVMFLGDFIDRGPEQVEVLRIVRTNWHSTILNCSCSLIISF